MSKITPTGPPLTARNFPRQRPTLPLLPAPRSSSTRSQLFCPSMEALFLSRALLIGVLGLGLLHVFDAVSHQVMIRPGALDPFSCQPAAQVLKLRHIEVQTRVFEHLGFQMPVFRPVGPVPSAQGKALGIGVGMSIGPERAVRGATPMRSILCRTVCGEVSSWVGSERPLSGPNRGRSSYPRLRLGL